MDYSRIMTPQELKKWREKNGYSQSQLAKALGVITISVSRWERGVREIPSFLHLALLGLGCMGKKGGEELRERGKLKRKEVKK
jgi:transcriptional regulator with XRE-family HTH domain